MHLHSRNKVKPTFPPYLTQILDCQYSQLTYNLISNTEKEKDLSQEEEEIPPQEQSLLSSNENFNHDVLVPFVNRTTRNRGFFIVLPHAYIILL